MVVQDYIRIYEAGLVIKCSGRKLYVSVLMCRNYKWAHLVLLLLPVVLYYMYLYFQMASDMSLVSMTFLRRQDSASPFFPFFFNHISF